MTTTEQLQTIIRRMALNLALRTSVISTMPQEKATDSVISEIDQEFQTDLSELNRLSPEPSIQYNEDCRNISQTGAQC